MEAVVARLEAVAAKLEATQARLDGNNSNAAVPAPVVAPQEAGPTAVASSGPVALAAPLLPAYQALLTGPLVATLDAAEAVGGEVLRATRLLAEGFRREAAVLEAMATCAKPSDVELQALLAPVGEQLVAAGELAGGPRGPYQQAFKYVAEAMQTLTWVAYTGPNCGLRLPAQHVEDAAAASEFYGNKVLMEWRAKEPKMVTWVQSIKALLAALKAFCSKHFPAGPSWKTGGLPVSQFKHGTTSPAAAAAPPPPQRKAPPAAPPPPPPGSLLAERPKPGASAAGGSGSSGGNPMAALFAEINKGGGVTAGLRKVTDDMKTKNRADRSGAVPPAPSAAAGTGTAPPKGGGSAPAGPPRVECEQGRKWVVENQVGNREIVIADTEPKQTVYIYGCRNSTIQVKGKVNSIALDKCSRCGLLFDSVVATVEVVNCQSVEVQAMGSVPTVAVDKVDGCQLFLSRESLSTHITTAKSSEVNVVVPGESEEADPLESAIPEQFVTRWVGSRWVTEPVAHSAA